VTADAWFAGGERVRVDLPSGSFEIFSRTAGSGPWLTFLHGFPTSSWDWAKVAPVLEGRFRLLCFDFLGFGDSDKPRRHRYSILEQADLTEVLWRRFGVAESGLVAHDYGATVAQELLARDRTAARISGVVLLNAAVYVRLARPLLLQKLLAAPLAGPVLARAISERTFARSLASVFVRPPERAELREHWRVLRRRGGTAPITPRLLRYMAERRKHAGRWEEALERSAVPLRFVWGMEDRRSGAHVAEEIRRLIPEADLVTLDGVGHYPQLEAPQQVAAAIARP
jgi:pimeloyl-ACP methyl ester carboxylesterase